MFFTDLFLLLLTNQMSFRLVQVTGQYPVCAHYKSGLVKDPSLKMIDDIQLYHWEGMLTLSDAQQVTLPHGIPVTFSGIPAATMLIGKCFLKD